MQSMAVAASPIGPAAIPRPTLGAVGLGAISASTGSIWLDAALGAAVGYVAAPAKDKLVYAAGGAAATGFAGVFGLLGTLGVAWLARR